MDSIAGFPPNTCGNDSQTQHLVLNEEFSSGCTFRIGMKKSTQLFSLKADNYKCKGDCCLMGIGGGIQSAKTALRQIESCDTAIQACLFPSHSIFEVVRHHEKDYAGGKFDLRMRDEINGADVPVRGSTSVIDPVTYFVTESQRLWPRRPEETRPSQTRRENSVRWTEANRRVSQLKKTSQGAAGEGNAADAPFISSRPLATQYAGYYPNFSDNFNVCGVLRRVEDFLEPDIPLVQADVGIMVGLVSLLFLAASCSVNDEERVDIFGYSCMLPVQIGPDGAENPNFNHDGSLVAIEVADENGRRDIHLHDSANGEMIEIASAKAGKIFNIGAQMSADGSRILYRSCATEFMDDCSVNWWEIGGMGGEISDDSCGSYRLSDDGTKAVLGLQALDGEVAACGLFQTTFGEDALINLHRLSGLQDDMWVTAINQDGNHLYVTSGSDMGDGDVLLDIYRFDTGANAGDAPLWLSDNSYRTMNEDAFLVADDNGTHYVHATARPDFLPGNEKNVLPDSWRLEVPYGEVAPDGSFVPIGSIDTGFDISAGRTPRINPMRAALGQDQTKDGVIFFVSPESALNSSNYEYGPNEGFLAGLEEPQNISHLGPDRTSPVINRIGDELVIAWEEGGSVYISHCDID